MSAWHFPARSRDLPLRFRGSHRLVVSIGVLQTLHLTLLPALLLDVIILSVFLGLLPKTRTAGVNVVYPPWDLPARMFAATSMVLFVTAGERLLGPKLSGLLAPFPVLAWPLCIFVHAQQGATEP